MAVGNIRLSIDFLTGIGIMVKVCIILISFVFPFYMIYLFIPLHSVKSYCLECDY